MIEFVVKVDEALLKTLSEVEDLAKTLREDGFGERMGTEVLQDGIRPYPPPNPGSTYVRTYRLFNSWHLATPAGAGTIFIVESSGVDYAPLVQQEATQAWMHRNNWQTDVEVAQAAEPIVAAEAEAFIEGLFK